MNKPILFYTSIFTLCLVVLTSCSLHIDDLEQAQLPIVDESASGPDSPHSCRLILDVTCQHYKESVTTRSDEDWKEGDNIFLTFPGESSNAYGEAVFMDGSWSVSYYGNLKEGGRYPCKAVFFDNPTVITSTNVRLSDNTGIYEAAEASYMFVGGVLSVVADLRPATGRIRFSGTDGERITIFGISRSTSYDITTGNFSLTASALTAEVNNGYTPYIYGFFTDDQSPRLNIITSSSAYTRQLSSSIFKVGESGFMSVPTPEYHNGWENCVRFYIKGVELTMLPVGYSTGNFLLAETETTEQLYSAVIDDVASPSLYPKYDITYAKWETFLSRLNAQTSLNFRIPTREEWQYAYSGGRSSQGYSYSGSNILSEVGWYKGNSGGSTHPVKQLKSNELGFYDMSGNVCELVKTGPGTSTDFYGWFGGYWNAPEKGCTMTSGFDFDYPEFGGLRMAMSIE